MDEEQPVIPSPQREETLSEYLQKFSDVEFKAITTNAELLAQFCAILQECFKEFEHAEDGLENLREIIERLNNFERLQFYLGKLNPIRKELLDSLDNTEKEIKKIFKYCAFGRLLGSTADILGTVGGLRLKEQGSSYANLAFRVASGFGLLGLVSTTTEMALSKKMFDDLMIQLQKDQQLMAPIQRWYQQCDELEDAMRAVFPFDITNEMVRNFENTGESEFTPVRLLSTFLMTIAEQDIGRMRDERLIRSLINFTLHPASQDWSEWVIFHRHPVMLDITRVVLQLQNSPLRFALYQSIPALPPQEQNLQSFPVLGRIVLNAVSIYDAVISLRSSDSSRVASAIHHLREHLASEMAALQRIVEFVRSRRNR